MGLIRTSTIPTSVRKLIQEYRDGLVQILKTNLVGAYLHGSVVFPGYQPQAGDIDFYTVTRRALDKREVDGLDVLHRFLASKHEFGRKLDGFYIPLAKARLQRNPENPVCGVHGRIHPGGHDDAWALHREHFHSSANIRLYGPPASRIFATPDWSQIRTALFRQLTYARKIIDNDPWWSVLNLCRMIYSFEQGRVVISKIRAARWALKNLPEKYRPVISSAIRTYNQRAGPKDRALLRREARRFLGFASVRIIAFDTTWDSRQPHIAHLRKKETGGKG